MATIARINEVIVATFLCNYRKTDKTSSKCFHQNKELYALESKIFCEALYKTERTIKRQLSIALNWRFVI